MFLLLAIVNISQFVVVLRPFYFSEELVKWSYASTPTICLHGVVLS